jgi:hypothetical protein
MRILVLSFVQDEPSRSQAQGLIVAPTMAISLFGPSFLRRSKYSSIAA